MLPGQRGSRPTPTQSGRAGRNPRQFAKTGYAQASSGVNQPHEGNPDTGTYSQLWTTLRNWVESYPQFLGNGRQPGRAIGVAPA